MSDVVKSKQELIRKLNNGVKEVEVSKQLFDADLTELGGTVRISTGRSKQVGPDQWVFDGMEYFIRKNNEL